MKHYLNVRFWGAVSFIFLFALFSPTWAQRIMPLGDSITQGSSDGGYRDDLDALLNGEGVTFNFVGTLTDGTGFDADHEGHSGFRADEIANNLDTWVTQLGSLEPRFYLIHVGTEDISQGQSVQSTINDIEAIVDYIYNRASYNSILLSSLIPRNDGNDGLTTALNELIKELYYTKRSQGYNIYYVGQNEVFKANSNWATDYMADATNPNATGYHLMAEVYFNALMNAFYAFTNNKPLLTEYFSRTQLGETWAADPEFQITGEELENSSTVSSWDYLATYIAQSNPSKVAIEWGATADYDGIKEGGLALMLDSQSADANGYLLWYSATGIRLWEILSGAPVNSIAQVTSNLTFPQAGDRVEVELSSDDGGHHFTLYINGVRDTTITDPDKRQGNATNLFAGVMLKGNLNNNISYFDLLGAGGGGPGDQTPPAAVTDLTAINPAGNSITLTWTAVGDDSLTGTAAAYDVRYSMNPITNDDDFNFATEATGEPAPSVSGTTETFEVTGLQSTTTYYFAMKVMDEALNYSGLSNSTSETTLAGDDVPPAQVTDLAASNPTENNVTLTWTAVGDDGTEGTAASYDVRYSTSPINDDADFAAATLASGEPTPSAPGTQETFIVSGLQTSTTYYFALKVIDDASNASPLSNTASATTIVTTVIYTTDDFNRASLGSNWVASPEIQIQNDELANTSTVAEWGYIALYKPTTNPAEVAFRWSATADAGGIEQGGFALKMDDSTTTANGYFLWIRPSIRTINLYVLENGLPAYRIGTALDMDAGAPTPDAGSLFKVKISSDAEGHHFDCYIDDQYAGRISDPNKEQGTTGGLYAGVYLKGNLNNNLDDFTVGVLGEVDEVPPAMVTDLTVSSTSISSATLTWTAVGDNGMDGVASSYDMRYSTDPINSDADFSAATEVSGEPAPAASGSQETFVVNGLNSNTTYYFALKVRDDAGNASLSNSASGTTKSANVTTDDFNRTELGANWNADPEFQIVNNELANTSTVYDWNYIAVYNARTNPIEVYFKWGAQATSAGIEEGGMALMMSAASPNASGYAVWIRPSVRTIRLWTISNGSVTTSVDQTTLEASAPTPQAGSIFKVQLSSDAQGHHFDCYVNGVYAGRVTDANKLQGNGSTLYAGVILKGNLSNNIDDFSEVNIGGDPKYLEYVSGDGQFGTIGEALPGSLIVRVTDENHIPTANVAVNFSVIQGDATLDLLPPDNNVRIEAEAGSLTPNMVIGNDPNASGGRYIYAPTGGPKEGSADYSFNLPVSGNYYVWGRIYSPSGIEDSFFFVMDGSADTLLWDLGSPYATWRWAKFTDRTTGVFNQYLNAGNHTFSVVKRESNARIDKIIFTTDAGFVPSGKEEVPTYVTDEAGEAKAEVTLGTTVGQVIVQADVPGLEGSPVNFTLTARAGDAVKIIYVSGNDQTGTGGQLLAQPFVVQCLDVGNNPVYGWPVTFEEIQGGGFPSNDQPVLTDETGYASTTWTLGTEDANNIIHAVSTGLEGSPVVFNAVATAGIASEMSYVSGDDQSGTVGQPLALPFKVRVVDGEGGAIVNHRVLFKVVSGGGSLGDVPLSEKEVLTDADGYAEVTLTLGDTAGVQNNVVEASAMGASQHLTGSPYYFKASANPDEPSTIEYVSGNGQTGATNRPLGAPFVVKVTDQFGNGISPHEVTFEVKQGGGFITPTGPWYTEAGGLASVTLTLGPQAGITNEVWASATYNGTPLTNSPVVFQATAGTVTSINYVKGNGQTGSAGYPVDDSLEVRILDNYGNPVSGYQVTFSTMESANPGTFDGTSNQQIIKSTDSYGIARVKFYCGPIWGVASTVKAISEGLTGSPVIFSVNVADLSGLQYVSGNGQTGTVGSPLPEPFKVKVVDELGKSFPNYKVTYTVKQGGGNFSGSTSIDKFTDSETHEAEAILTLGPSPGNNNNVAEATAVYKGSQLGTPITFVASSIIGNANELVEVSGNYGSAVVGNPLEDPFVVKITDAFGNAIFGHPVLFTIKEGGGSLDGGLTTITKLTDVNGMAQVILTVGLTAGINNNAVEVVSYKQGTQTHLVGSPLTFYASGLSSAATQLLYVSGNGQAVSPVRTALAQPFRVKVTDNQNNPVPNQPVNWVVTQGNGTFNNLTDTTATTFSNSSGIAEVTYYPGPVAGVTNIVKAHSWNGPELNGSPITFTVDTEPAAVSVAKSEVSGTGPVPADGVSQSTITVTLMDDYSNKIPGKALSMLVSGSNNTIFPFTSLTNSNGQAIAYLASTKAEVKVVTIINISDGITLQDTAQVRFVPLAAYSISYVAGTNQTSNFGAACKNPIQARVADIHGNVIEDYPVYFEAYVGGGRIYEEQPATTDSNGIASAYWVLGPSEEVNRARAVAEGLVGSPVEFIATAHSGVASTLNYVSGNQQTGTAGLPLPEPLVVQVVDDIGDPIAGHVVKFNVDFGGGNFNGKTSEQVYTDVFGYAQAYYTLGRLAGSNIASAEATGLSGSPRRFTAMGIAGPPQKIIKHAGDNSTIRINGSRWIQIKVTDIFDNPVAGYEVGFSVVVGDAKIRSGYETATSDANGIASSLVDAGTTLEEVKVLVAAPGLIGDGLKFTLQIIARPAVVMEIHSGNNQQGTIGRELVYPLAVIVKDDYGNPAGGQNIPITFALTGEKGVLLDPQPCYTDENGIARTRLQLEDATGELYKVWAIKTGLNGSPLEFKATGVTNNFPLYDEIPDYTIKENETISFSVNATDADGDPVTYGIRSLPQGAQFDSVGTKQFNWKPDYFQAGTYTVHFMAWDNQGGFDDEPVTITVENLNRLPQIINYEPVAYSVIGHLEIGEIFRFMVQVVDADNDELTYEWYNDDLLVSTKNYYDCRVSEQSLAGHIILVKVSDGYDTVEHDWYLYIKTPVELASFSGRVLERQGVELVWETTTEYTTAGFNVYRKSAISGSYEKINDQLIGTDGTKHYKYVDRTVKVGGTYQYKLEDVSATGEKTMHEAITISIAKPKSYSLSQNYPNPFNSRTLIHYQLPEQNRVTIKIFNILGQEVKTLVDDVKEAGYHTALWNGLDKYDNQVSSGVYYYRIVSGSFVQSKKMVLLK